MEPALNFHATVCLRKAIGEAIHENERGIMAPIDFSKLNEKSKNYFEGAQQERIEAITQLRAIYANVTNIVFDQAKAIGESQ